MRRLISIPTILVLFACSDPVTQPDLSGIRSTPAFPTSALASCVAPADGLLSWWPADGDANDVQGGHHATLTNGATFAPGKLGQAFSFDGVDDWVRIEDFGYPMATEFTIAAWILMDGSAPQSSSGWWTIYADDSWGFWLYNYPPLEPSAEGFVINWWQGTNVLLGNSQIPPGEWHHITLTYGAGAFSGYLDGHLDGTSSFASTRLPGDGGGLGIGRHQSEPFKGLIDELRVYDGALSPAEVAALACVSPVAQVDAMSSDVASLMASGGLEEGNGNALQSTLTAVFNALQNDKPNVTNLLNAFINKVAGFINGGLLSPADGQSLIDAAEALITQLES